MKFFKLVVAVAALISSLLYAQSSFANDDGHSMLLFVASKTNGICSYHVDTQSGALSDFKVAANAGNPQFFALHPTKPILYSLNSAQLDGKKAAVVSAFSIDKKGALQLLNQQPAGTAGPTHLTVDRAGKSVLIANYGGGSVAAFPLQADGSLAPQNAFVQHQGSSVHPQRQQGPHAHQIVADPTDRYALVCDLGLDKVLVYQIDSKGKTLTPNNPPFGSLKPGAGPRHLDFHPNGRFAYVINELDSTMTVFQFEAKNGAMKELQTISTLPSDFTGKNSPAEVYVHPSGKFLYGSNRGHDSIVVYAIHEDGKLSLLQHEPTQAKAPRHFAMDPSGVLLCAEGQESNNLVTFHIDPKTGKLKPTGNTVELNSPSCAVFYRLQ